MTVYLGIELSEVTARNPPVLYAATRVEWPGLMTEGKWELKARQLAYAQCGVLQPTERRDKTIKV
jgi:hypothetical protein